MLDRIERVARVKGVESDVRKSFKHFPDGIVRSGDEKQSHESVYSRNEAVLPAASQLLHECDEQSDTAFYVVLMTHLHRRVHVAAWDVQVQCSHARLLYLQGCGIGSSVDEPSKRYLMVDVFCLSHFQGDATQHGIDVRLHV